jgi:uncharacterized protein
MRLLVYLGHPAHFHLFRNTIAAFKNEGVEVHIVIKKKDVLATLLDGMSWPYYDVLPRERRTASRAAATWGLAVRDWRLFRIAKRTQPTLMVGTSAEIAHVGRILGIRTVVMNEDDWDVVPLFARVAYPWADHILAPRCCRMGKWAGKTTFYDSFHELAYLHPNHFRPDADVCERLRSGQDRYFILRLARLSAHHDVGRSGIADSIARQLIGVLEPHGRVLITSERELSSEFECYRIAIDPLQMHDALAGADLYVGDSQTMAAEAAVLGTPSVRFNDFVGEISYLDELETRYGLTVGVRTGERDRLLRIVEAMVSQAELKRLLGERRATLLSEKCDLSQFLHWYFQDVPGAERQLATDPAFPLQFTGPGSMAEAR